MAKNNQTVIYTYRYIWKVKETKKDFFNVKYITGTEDEQKRFMSALINDETVICASRIYVNEINISLTEQHEIVKKERK